MSTASQHLSKQFQEEVQLTASTSYLAKDIRFQAVLPSQNTRYSAFVSRDPTIIPETIIPRLTSIASLSSGTLPLPEGWTENIAPEGQVYFHHNDRRIVTSADVRLPDIARRLVQGSERLVVALGHRGGFDNAELYLNLGHPDALEYYCIDHNNCQPFWVEAQSTSDLGLFPYESPGFLKSQLTSEYWTHMDYFPSHQAFDERAETELMNILRYYYVDDMTSPGSTSPYSAKECGQYLKLLEGFRASGDYSYYRIATVARLWASVARVRHINAYGLKSPRLDRLQGLSQYTFEQTKPSLKLSWGEFISFHRSRRIFDQLTALWNGRVVYQRHWHTFFHDMNQEWLRMGGLSLAIFVVDAIMFASGRMTMSFMGSASLAASAVFSALLLHQSHSGGRLATAPDISAYVMRVEDLHHGLRPLSLTFTLPHALTTYSGLFLITGLLIQTMEKASSLTESLIITCAWCLPFSVVFFLANVL